MQKTNQAIVKKTVLLNEMEDIAALPNKPTMCMTSLTGIWFQQLKITISVIVSFYENTTANAKVESSF